MNPEGFYQEYYLARLQPSPLGRFSAAHSGVFSQPNSSFAPYGSFPGSYDIINTTASAEQPATIYAVEEPMTSFDRAEVSHHMQDTSEPSLADVFGRRMHNDGTHCVGCNEMLPAGRRNRTKRLKHKQLSAEMTQ